MKKQSIDFNAMGEVEKQKEKISQTYLMSGVPIIARLDGRAFHTVLKNAKKPFDEDVINAMQITSKELLCQFHADLVYTQSDEITLVWKSLDLFNRNIQKLTSSLASYASVIFNKYFSSKHICTFDARIWAVSSLEEVVDNLIWRELDASRNAVNMVVHTLYSQKEVEGKSHKERLEMIFNKNINFSDYPDHCKKGSYFVKNVVMKNLTEEELNKIPEIYRKPKDTLFARGIIEELKIPKLLAIKNVSGVLFNKEEVELY